MKFKHYIITRLAIPDSSVEWLDYRVDLFHKFYLKGLSIQTVKNFSVILLVSDNIKYDFSKFISNDSNCKIYSYESFFSNPSSILSADDLDFDSIISTRLDSDDLLANHYVENVQKHAVVDSIIDHKYYYFLDNHLEKFSLRTSNCNSMFLSTCCIPSEFNQKYCLAAPHLLLGQNVKFAQRKIIPAVGSSAICHGPNSNTKWFRSQEKQTVNKETFNSLFSSKDFSFFK